MTRKQDMPAGKAQTDARRERLLILITREGCKSLSTRELAARLTDEGYPCCHTTVLDDLAAVRAQMAANTQRDAAEWIAEQLADLDALHDALWPMKEDPRNAAQIIRIAERKAKLLGLDKPARTELTGKDGAPLEINAAIDLATDAVWAGLLDLSQAEVPPRFDD
jgi:hypothetical protein